MIRTTAAVHRVCRVTQIAKVGKPRPAAGIADQPAHYRFPFLRGGVLAADGDELLRGVDGVIERHDIAYELTNGPAVL